jgi:hypothetical protein
MVSLLEEPEGVRICLDDVACQNIENKIWIQKEHITNKLSSKESFDELSFEDKELAEFGFYILARLHALRSRGES